MNHDAYIKNIVDNSDRVNWDLQRWDQQIKFRAAQVKHLPQLQELYGFYPGKIARMEGFLAKEMAGVVAKEAEIPGIEIELEVIRARKREINQLFLEGKQSTKEMENLISEFMVLKERKNYLKESLSRQKWIDNLTAKVERLKDKLVIVNKEIEIRNKDLIYRNPIGTTYYIDLNAGNDGSAGTATGTAWLTIEKYTTTTVRSAGDIGKIRANTTETPAADVLFDEDGVLGNFIELRGCSVADDPWSDSSNVRPVIDFNSGAKKAELNGDNFWKIENIEWRDGDDDHGMFRLTSFLTPRSFTLFENCKFVEYGEADDDEGALYILGGFTQVNNCEFDNNRYNHIVLGANGTVVEINDSTFEGGQEGGSTDQALFFDYAACTLLVNNCEFGQNDAFDNAWAVKSYSAAGVEAFFRNCKFQDATNIYFYQQSIYPGQERCLSCVSHDHNQVAGAVFFAHGSSFKIYSDPASNRATSSAPYALLVNGGWWYGSTSDKELAVLSKWGEVDETFKIWAPASETTVTIYVKGNGWTTHPTSSEFYLKANYLSGASGADRATVSSNDANTDNTTWVAFDVTFTPGQAGWVFLDFFVKSESFDANAGWYIDPLPLVT